jgi:hypothetical protein
LLFSGVCEIKLILETPAPRSRRQRLACLDETGPELRRIRQGWPHGGAGFLDSSGSVLV